jgi:hypothetical protein
VLIVGENSSRFNGLLTENGKPLKRLHKEFWIVTGLKAGVNGRSRSAIVKLLQLQNTSAIHAHQ